MLLLLAVLVFKLVRKVGAIQKIMLGQIASHLEKKSGILINKFKLDHRVYVKSKKIKAIGEFLISKLEIPFKA